MLRADQAVTGHARGRRYRFASRAISNGTPLEVSAILVLATLLRLVNQHNQVNSVSGHVSGPVVQANNISGPVVFNSQVIHVAVTAVEEKPGFAPGGEIEVSGITYAVHDHLFDETWSTDSRILHRQARVTRSDGALGWLRQVRGAAEHHTCRALASERDRLAETVSGWPEVLQFHEQAQTTTLVTSWPRGRSGRPAGSMPIIGEPVSDRGLLRAYISGLAGLCTALGELHSRGTSHRAVAPETILVREDGAVVLRDLGLAAHLPRVGEGLEKWQAPEQLRRDSAGRPGPWTDVRQVAAIAHLLVTGHRPDLRQPPPVVTWNGSVPDRLAATIDAALVADPKRRPPIGWLGTQLGLAGNLIR
ncbi:hypothetical protein AB0425_03890 [Actinosynnema sp. NPDC051121]